MFHRIRTAALAATLALSAAVPAAATVLNFEFFSSPEETTLLWGAKIDFGDFDFKRDLTDVTEGITLTQPAAPFDTGTASYVYFWESSAVRLNVTGTTSDLAAEPYTYRFWAYCVPLCDDGTSPYIDTDNLFRSGSGVFTALTAAVFPASVSTAITDVTLIPTEPAAVIPLPAAGWLLLGGLGALGLIRRRTRAR